MEKRELTKEDLDKVRDIEGFPIGTDEDIIALSDAPYYTACPNPFIKEFIKENGTPYNEEMDNYHCEPYTEDISEGKHDRLYMIHRYMKRLQMILGLERVSLIIQSGRRFIFVPIVEESFHIGMRQ